MFGVNPAEHEQKLHAVSDQIKATGITLNAEKCQFSKTCITFLGHVLDQDGISPDLQRTAVILAMRPPSLAIELCSFMGMVNQMTKFSPNIAHISKPLRELLSTKNSWSWESLSIN